jgi:hypothetical protein
MHSGIRSSALAALFSVLFVLSSQAQVPGPVLYQVESASTYSEGCYAPCLCPIFFGGAPTGTFELRYLSTDPAGFDHYLVQNVDWMLNVGGTMRHVTGGGQYRRGGQVAVLEQLMLDLSQDGAASEHFDSGVVVPQSPFPRIDLTISINGMFCYDRVFELATSPKLAGSAYCFGDGSGTACPCGNAGLAGNGCASSVNPAGANLIGNGFPSIAADTVMLISTGTPSAPALFFQGTARTSGGAGATFGDGLLCASGIVTRLKLTQAVLGEARVPVSGDPQLSQIGGITAPGTYAYQVWYREAPAFCTPATFNLTNGYEIVWTN